MRAPAPAPVHTRRTVPPFSIGGGLVGEPRRAIIAAKGPPPYRSPSVSAQRRGPPGREKAARSPGFPPDRCAAMAGGRAPFLPSTGDARPEVAMNATEQGTCRNGKKVMWPNCRTSLYCCCLLDVLLLLLLVRRSPEHCFLVFSTPRGKTTNSILGTVPCTYY